MPALHHLIEDSITKSLHAIETPFEESVKEIVKKAVHTEFSQRIHEAVRKGFMEGMEQAIEEAIGNMSVSLQVAKGHNNLASSNSGQTFEDSGSTVPLGESAYLTKVKIIDPVAEVDQSANKDTDSFNGTGGQINASTITASTPLSKSSLVRATEGLKEDRHVVRLEAPMVDTQSFEQPGTQAHGLRILTKSPVIEASCQTTNLAPAEEVAQLHKEDYALNDTSSAKSTSEPMEAALLTEVTSALTTMTLRASKEDIPVTKGSSVETIGGNVDATTTLPLKEKTGPTMEETSPALEEDKTVEGSTTSAKEAAAAEEQQDKPKPKGVLMPGGYRVFMENPGWTPGEKGLSCSTWAKAGESKASHSAQAPSEKQRKHHDGSKHEKAYQKKRRDARIGEVKEPRNLSNPEPTPFNHHANANSDSAMKTNSLDSLDILDMASSKDANVEVKLPTNASSPKPVTFRFTTPNTEKPHNAKKLDGPGLSSSKHAT